MRLYEISRNLYVSGSPRERDIPALKEAGVTAMLCLSKKRTPIEVIESVRNWAYLPIPDGKALPLADLEQIQDLVIRWLDQDEVVLIHCLQGRNRSMLAAALVSRVVEGWTGAEAFEHVRIMRPSSLHNPVFAEHLRSLP